MPSERRMDDHSRGDVVPAVDHPRLAGEDLAQDFLHRLRRIAADRAASASLRRRSHLRAGERVYGIDRADVAIVKRGGIVEEEIDLLELLLLHVEHGVGELVQLAGMVPVTMTDDDPDD